MLDCIKLSIKTESDVGKVTGKHGYLSTDMFKREPGQPKAAYKACQAAAFDITCTRMCSCNGILL